MPSRLEKCADLVRQLTTAVSRAESVTQPFELPPLAGREWFDLLNRKLIPQLGDDSFLIVGVVGGTNIGKSVVFNHIAGGRVSSTSPLASGTKHPTALIPVELLPRIHMDELFPGFELCHWESPDQPLLDDERHFLFWTESETTPSNLIILDTPDVDSVAEVNWERAAHVRQSADVLIAVLTQQKYNDAAVKEFFRKAAQENKLVIIVFNQCLLPDDEEYWPLWVGTFCGETGVRPHAVYLAPNDRRAAEANQLPFFERPWPVPEGSQVTASDDEPARDLLQELSELQFAEIKIQTLTGALEQLTASDRGVPSWMVEIRKRAQEFQDALELMSAQRLVEIDRWPPLPNSVMIAQIRQWWRGQREGWSAAVHGFYNRVGEVVSYPVKLIRERSAGEHLTPFEIYGQQEWETVLEVLDRSLERLTWLRDLGNPLLSPRLDKILNGVSRAGLIEQLRQEHTLVDFERELQSLISHELANFREESPDSYKLIRRIDSMAAAARPAVSVVLFMTGAGPVGDIFIPAMADTVAQGALHVAGDAVGGTIVTAVGDTLISDGAASGMGYLEARFRRLHAVFAKHRAAWMARQLEKHLFGSLPQELAEASKICECDEFRRVEQILAELQQFTWKLTETGDTAA